MDLWIASVCLSRRIDLSGVASPESTPELLRTDIQFADHVAGAAQVNEMFGIGPELLRNGEGVGA